MKRNTITIQIVQKGILVPYKNKINYHKLYSVDNYKIINKNMFLEEFSNLVSKYKLNNKFLTDNINIIIDNIYTEIDKTLIKDIFKELSFNKIEYLNITDILNIKDKELILDLSVNHLKIYFNEEILSTPIYFAKYQEILSIYLKKILSKNHIKEIKIFGNNCLKKKLFEELEQEIGIKIYIYSHPELMPIHLLV